MFRIKICIWNNCQNIHECIINCITFDFCILGRLLIVRHSRADVCLGTSGFVASDRRETWKGAGQPGKADVY